MGSWAGGGYGAGGGKGSHRKFVHERYAGAVTISGIHGDDPVMLYAELTQLVAEVIAHFEETGRPLPPPTVRPMREVG